MKKSIKRIIGLISFALISSSLFIGTNANAQTIKSNPEMNYLKSSSAALGGKYGTNPNNQVGSEGTVTIDGSFTDWKESDMIAKGVANDDPRTFRGDHEGPVYDDYALYAKWDDTNLYIMWQYTNVTDVVDPAQGYPISDNGKPANGDIPQILAFSIDPNKSGDGKSTGTDAKTGAKYSNPNIWTIRVNYQTKVDTLLYFSSKPGVGQPAMFKTNSDGLFDYDTSVGFTKGGISFKYGDGFLNSTMDGINANGYSGYVPSDLLSQSSKWVDFLKTSHSKKQDTMYEMKIPLATLGVTKDYIENNGIGVMHISTFGQSGINSVPMDMGFLDTATQPYGPDASTSEEKEDYDVVTAPLASIGKIRDASDVTTPTTGGSTGATTTPATTTGGGSTTTPATTTGGSTTGSTTTVPIVQDLDVTNFAADKASVVAGNSVTLSAKGIGGTGTYQYQFFANGNPISSYSDNSTFAWTPSVAGNYDLSVRVKDSSGTIVESSSINCSVSSNSTQGSTTTTGGTTTTGSTTTDVPNAPDQGNTSTGGNTTPPPVPGAGTTTATATGGSTTAGTTTNNSGSGSKTMDTKQVLPVAGVLAIGATALALSKKRKSVR